MGLRPKVAPGNAKPFVSDLPDEFDPAIQPLANRDSLSLLRRWRVQCKKPADLVVSGLLDHFHGGGGGNAPEAHKSNF